MICATTVKEVTGRPDLDAILTELATGRTSTPLIATMHKVIKDARGQTLDDALEAVANALRQTAKEAANAHQNVIQLRPGKPALRLVV